MPFNLTDVRDLRRALDNPFPSVVMTSVGNTAVFAFHTRLNDRQALRDAIFDECNMDEYTLVLGP